MFSRILTPLDGSTLSEQVLPYARSLAAALSLPMTLLYAIEPEVLTIPRVLNPSLHLEEMATYRITLARNYMAPVSDDLQRAGVNVDVEIPQGEPAESIVGRAERDPSTLYYDVQPRPLRYCPVVDGQCNGQSASLDTESDAGDQG